MDLEKAFDGVPIRKATEWALRRQKESERLVTAVMSLYAESRSRVKTIAGISEVFDIIVRVHQDQLLAHYSLPQ